MQYNKWVIGNVNIIHNDVELTQKENFLLKYFFMK